MSTAKDRIEYLVQKSGGTVKAYALLVGLQPQNLYDIINGKTKGISDNVTDKIISKYPEINRVWLITGEGDAEVDQSGTGNISQYRVTNSPVNPTATVEAFLSELGAQRRVTEKALDQFARSQDQIDRLIALLEQKANK